MCIIYGLIIISHIFYLNAHAANNNCSMTYLKLCQVGVYNDL